MFSWEFWDISKNTFFQRTPLEAASKEPLRYYIMITIPSVKFIKDFKSSFDSLMWNTLWNNWIIYVSEIRKLSIMPVNNCNLKYVKKDKSHFEDFFYLVSEAWIVCRILSKVKNDLKLYKIYICDLGLTFLSLMSAYWWKNYILNFQKLISLTLSDTLKRTQKVDDA